MYMRVKKLVFYNHLAFNVNPLVLAVLISLHIHVPQTTKAFVNCISVLLYAFI